MFIYLTNALQMTLVTRKDLMARQRALFTDIEERLSADEPRGFRYQEQIISEEIEASLAAELGQLDLRPFEFHGHFGNRRVVNFGLKYDFSRRSVQRADDMPSFLDDLLNRAASFAGCEKDAFRQVGVNDNLLAQESVGTRTNPSLESSLECHCWRLRRCGFGDRTTKNGSGPRTP